MDPLFYRRLGKLLTQGCLLLITAAPLQAQSLLTLEEVIERVLADNFDIQTARNKQKIAAKDHHIGKAGFLPSLDAKLDVSKKHQTWPQRQNTDGVNLLPGLGLSWNVFNGMQRIFTYRSLGKLSQISQLETQQKIEEKIAEAIKGYYTLALAQKKKHELENSLMVSKEVLHLAKVKYEVGRCDKLEYLNAQVEYNKEQDKLLLQEEQLTKAKFDLRNLLGKDGPEEFTIVDDIPLPLRLTWDSLTKALSLANPSVLIAQKKCENAVLNTKLKKADLWPKVDLSLGYDLGSNYHDQRWEATPRSINYGITITYNLFDAFQHATKIQKAGIETDNAYLELGSQKMKLEDDLKKHFLNYTQQLQRYELSQQHVQVSQENVALALEQYRLGKITLLALETAKQNAQNTTLDCLEALCNAKKTEIELQKLGGTLLNSAR